MTFPLDLARELAHDPRLWADGVSRLRADTLQRVSRGRARTHEDTLQDASRGWCVPDVTDGPTAGAWLALLDARAAEMGGSVYTTTSVREHVVAMIIRGDRWTGTGATRGEAAGRLWLLVRAPIPEPSLVVEGLTVCFVDGQIRHAFSGGTIDADVHVLSDGRACWAASIDRGQRRPRKAGPCTVESEAEAVDMALRWIRGAL